MGTIQSVTLRVQYRVRQMNQQIVCLVKKMEMRYFLRVVGTALIFNVANPQRKIKSPNVPTFQKGGRIRYRTQKALKLLSLPREVDLTLKMPNNRSWNCRYGPFVRHERSYANLRDPDDVFNIGMNRAVEELAKKQQQVAGVAQRPKRLKN